MAGGVRVNVWTGWETARARKYIEVQRRAAVPPTQVRVRRAYESVDADPGGETEEIETGRSGVQRAALGVGQTSCRPVQPLEGVDQPTTGVDETRHHTGCVHTKKIVRPIKRNCLRTH
jgi:hypothetical protein